MKFQKSSVMVCGPTLDSKHVRFTERGTKKFDIWVNHILHYIIDLLCYIIKDQTQSCYQNTPKDKSQYLAQKIKGVKNKELFSAKPNAVSKRAVWKISIVKHSKWKGDF